MPYYGSGPDSRKDRAQRLPTRDTNVELRPGVRIYKGLRRAASAPYLAVNVGPGHASRYISSEQQFGPGVAPGIDRQTNFWRGGGLVEYDWRDRASNPTSGGRYSAQYVRYLAHDLGRYSFLRLDLDASQYIPLFNRTRVIALHGASSLTTTGANQSVPFYLQPTLGGPDTLRGYRFDRFYGDNSTMVSAEYRWDASPFFRWSRLRMEERSSIAGSSGISTSSKATSDSACASGAAPKWFSVSIQASATRGFKYGFA